jgi:hypothetical protein
VSVCHLRIGDGRDDVHERAHASIREMLPRPDKIVIVDDAEHELGFAGAIAEGWRQVRDTGCDYVVHLEMDFIFHAPVPVERMIAVLERRPYLAQLVLKRGPENEQEREAGGIVECWPDEYRQVTNQGDVWTEHRLFWSTNPAVFSAGWCAQHWPQVDGSERAWTERLREDPHLRFAFWGGKFDPPMCEHIGVRVGHGY